VQDLIDERDSEDTRPVLLMACDEGRFGRLGQVKRAWCPVGCRPTAPQQLVREYLYAFAAVAPSLGQMTALVLPSANTAMMNLLLKQVSQDFKEYFIIMQMDGASYHVSSKLAIPENIRLLLQPPRSPELNPTEHIWEEVREKHFANRSFNSLEAVSDQLCQGLKALMDLPEKLKSMTNFPHLRISL
jgi:DDE superfamily endonuclease